MARADLHYAVAIDREIYDAGQVDPSLLDPIVRVDGGLPGAARPFIVLRDYQGPQGTYLEHFVLSDAGGRPIVQSAVRRVELTGEMFENRVTTLLDQVWFETGDEHRVTFYLNDDDVGSIPLFIEAGLGGDPWIAARETFTKALQKGAVVWLTVPQAQQRARRKDRRPAVHTQPVWFVFDGGKVYVFNGPTEQQVPGLAEAQRVEITARSKDIRSRVSHVPATVRTVPPDDPLFERIGRAGLGRRLNLPDGDGALNRWRTNCTLLELTPVFEPSAGAA